MNSFVYALADPRTGQIRYIGKTVNGLRRVALHKKPSALARDRTYKGNWIRSLLKEGLVYEVRILEYAEKEKVASREIFWIARGRAEGWPLTNLTDGGDGTHGLVISEATKAKMSAAHKGRVFTAEHKEALSAVLSGRKLTEEHRNRISAGCVGRKLTEAQKLALAASRRPASEETRRKLSVALSGRLVGPSTREKVAAARRKPVVDLGSGLIYPSIKEAASSLGLCERSIGLVVRGHFAQTGGHRFSFLTS